MLSTEILKLFWCCFRSDHGYKETSMWERAGLFLIRQRLNITSFDRRAYKAYFGLALGNQDKKWAPHTVFHNCEEMLRDWTKGKRKGLPFGIPMTWREPADHTTDCYFCLVNTNGIGKKNRHKILCPSIPSAIWPTLHSDELLIPVFKGFLLSEDMLVVTKSKRLLMKLKTYFQNLAIVIMRPHSH